MAGRLCVADLTGPDFGTTASHDYFLKNGPDLTQSLFVDGIFEIAPSARKSSPRAADRIVLVCRDGTLFGADPKGRVYKGALHPNNKRAMRRTILNAVCETPPRSKPVPGSARRMAIALPILGEVDPRAPRQSATVLVGRKLIDIDIIYLGPLPYRPFNGVRAR
jgi:hypothetical protein